MAASAGVILDRFGEPCGTATWLVLSAVAAAVGLALARRTWPSTVVVLLAWGALAAGWHHWRWSDVAGDDLARVLTDEPRPAWVRGVLRDVPGFKPGGEPGQTGVTRAVVDLVEVHAGGRWQRASGRAMLSVAGEQRDLRAGDGVEVSGSLALVAGPVNPGEFDYRAYLRAQAVRLRMSAVDPGAVRAFEVGPGGAFRAANRALGAVSSWSQRRLAAGLDPKVAPLAAALLLGRREGVDPDVNDAFARTGTTHLLAISGLHLQVLAGALGVVFRLCGMPRRGVFLAVGAATVAYALLVGLMPSVVRSAAVTLAYCGSGFVHRRARPGNTLALALLVTLALNPAHLFDVGCQLSFLAVAAIAWVAVPAAAWGLRAPDPLAAVERKFWSRGRRWARLGETYLVQGLTVSAVVWLAALPLVALRFHVVSPIGVLLNLPLIPLTSLALLAAGLSLGLSAVWEPLGGPAAWVCSVALSWTDAVVRWGASQRWGYTFSPAPGWAWTLVFYTLLGLATAAAVGRLRGRRVLAGLVVATLPVGAFQALGYQLGPREPSAEILAVGHGLAVVLPTGPGRALLYDCGRMRDPSVGRRVVAQALWDRGVRRLDAVVLSHADADHYNGLPDLLDRFRIDAVLVPPGFASGGANPGAAALLKAVRARGVVVREVVAGERWDAPSTGLSFLVRHPPRDWGPDEPDNARSVVLDVSALGYRLLLTGDLDGNGLRALTAELPPPVDVLLSPHHGGRSANPPWLYDWAKPALVVVSQRPPSLGSRDPLVPVEAADIPVLRTWRRGAVRLLWTRRAIEVWGFLDGAEASPRATRDDAGPP